MKRNEWRGNAVFFTMRNAGAYGGNFVDCLRFGLCG